MPGSLLVATIALNFGQCVTYSQSGGGGFNCGIFGFPPAIATAVNDLGWRCGYYQDCDSADHPFVWPAGGVFIPIEFEHPQPVESARAYGISDSGMIVGYVDWWNVSGTRAFSWQNQVVTILAPLSGDNQAEAYAANTAGEIVGQSIGNSGQRAVRWVGGAIQPLQLSMGPSSVARDITNTGQICGWMGNDPYPDPNWGGATPFIWHNGVTTSLPIPIPPGAGSGEAIRLNNLGDACGIFYVSNPSGAEPPFVRRACAWFGGQFVDLGMLPTATQAYANDINDAGEIVGYCETPTGLIPFIWRGGVMTDLRTFNAVAPPSLGLKIAYGINNKGQITGRGSSYGPGGHGVAFLLTPALPQTPGDVNCDGHANVTDLIAVITNWSPGPVGGNPADVNRDNRIDVGDLLAVVTHWQ